MFSSLSLTAVGIALLAVWRVTHLLWGEDGPADIFVRLRKAAGNGSFGKLLDCFYCLSLWVAVPFALLLAVSWPEKIILWLALSAGAILLERVTSPPAPPPPPALWQEDPLPSIHEEASFSRRI
jgi:hypothetical protein